MDVPIRKNGKWRGLEWRRCGDRPLPTAEGDKCINGVRCGCALDADAGISTGDRAIAEGEAGPVAFIYLTSFMDTVPEE